MTDALAAAREAVRGGAGEVEVTRCIRALITELRTDGARLQTATVRAVAAIIKQEHPALFTTDKEAYEAEGASRSCFLVSLPLR